MSAGPDAPAQLEARWKPLDGVGDVRVGEVASSRRVDLSGERIARLRAALRSVVDDVEPPISIADICPDPLVFAVQSGLPRPTAFDRSIDGGSTWRDTSPIGDGPLFAVSQVTDIAERPTRDGRQLVRVVYETRFTDPQGVLVGTAAGISIHTGSPH
jgi:hypothetical protein